VHPSREGRYRGRLTMTARSSGLRPASGSVRLGSTARSWEERPLSTFSSVPSLILKVVRSAMPWNVGPNRRERNLVVMALRRQARGNWVRPVSGVDVGAPLKLLSF